MDENLLILLPPSLHDLVKKRQFADAETLLNRDLATVKHQYDDFYTRNKHLSELYFQYAVIAYENSQRSVALEQARQSFLHDVFSFHQQPALVNIALAEGSDVAQDFASEVSWWFFVAHESVNGNDPLRFWAENDRQQADDGIYCADSNIMDSTLTHYSNLSKVKQHMLSKELFFKRIQLVNNASTVETVLEMCDAYEEKGTPEDWCRAQKTVALFNAERYADVVSLWQGRDTGTIEGLWIYMRLLISRIYTGEGLPDTLVAVDAGQANDYYGVMTTLLNNYREICRAIDCLDDDVSEVDKTKLIKEKAEIERLTFFISEHGLALYSDTEQGKLINGYANDAHFYAMYCRNFSIILNYANEPLRSLALSEKGFSLSPFIENGYAMVNLPFRMKEYDRAQSNIDTVRHALGDYLDFNDVFYLDSRELNAKASKGSSTYFPVEQIFKEKYADFLHHMRVNAFPSDEMRPQAVVDWTEDYQCYIGNIGCATALLLEKEPDNLDVIAYAFEVKALKGGRTEIDWAKQFASNIKRIKADKLHPNYKANLFKSCVGLGYLKLREADETNSKKTYKEGIVLIEEGIQQGEAGTLDLADAHVKAGQYLQLIEESERADGHLSKAISLLESQNSALGDMGFIGDPLLSYAHFYRGKARDSLPKKIRPSDTEISDDFVRFCQLNNGEESFLAAYQVAYLSSDDESRVDEQYYHAMQYIDAVEAMEADFPERGNIMSLTIINLMKCGGSKERATALFEALKKDFPKHSDLKFLTKYLKKSVKRKKFLGIF